jgi:hypothetical protein
LAQGDPRPQYGVTPARGDDIGHRRATRFMHIWPYPSLEGRNRPRAKAISDGVWPPPGGPTYLTAQQTDIYLPAEFSPLN